MRSTVLVAVVLALVFAGIAKAFHGAEHHAEAHEDADECVFCRGLDRTASTAPPPALGISLPVCVTFRVAARGPARIALARPATRPNARAPPA
ncbi:MAG: hypothetical protein AAFX85_03760 [Pseudomonadota bacterium]